MHLNPLILKYRLSSAFTMISHERYKMLRSRQMEDQIALKFIKIIAITACLIKPIVKHHYDLIVHTPFPRQIHNDPAKFNL